MICNICQRERTEEPSEKCKDTHSVVSCFVAHEYFGCDTGCCGHKIYGLDKNDHEIFSHFEFDHLGEGMTEEEFVQTIVGKHLPGIQVDWKRCDIRGDIC